MEKVTTLKLNPPVLVHDAFNGVMEMHSIVNQEWGWNKHHLDLVGKRQYFDKFGNAPFVGPCKISIDSIRDGIRKLVNSSDAERIGVVFS